MADDNTLKSQVDQREKDVNNRVGSGDTKGALKLALADPPVAAKDEKIKDKNAETVQYVMMQVKEKDIEAHCASLDADELDVLMKYIYRAFRSYQNSAHFLKWHSAATSKGGLGTIVRAMSDRRVV